MFAAFRVAAVVLAVAAAHPDVRSASQVTASWMYLAETEADWWYTVPFAQVDVLYIAPAGIQRSQGGRFGMLPELETKFVKVAAAARKANPSIRLLVSQWWGEGKEDVWGESLAKLGDINAYARSVASFVEQHCLDGFDIDYEGGNVLDDFTPLATALRSALDSSKPGLLLTVSPDEAGGLTSESLRHVDYVNMQSYAGGNGLAPSKFTGLGFPSTSLIYGICPESNCAGPSAESACSTVKASGLGGIHVWRLNSDNHDAEGQTLERVRQMMQSGECSGAAAPVVLV
eukprot:CAMPEP_0168428168 /NCGR_PEP_ID=MMETSP0228-20121227/36721_1 /TAXON_ID=133427 /ORGANISM="Protoceratium reticulatum, Strain CCCM 535 (=CCMP 1889)" /LENGTH=286 /DNA_ID=CAMNT_0008442225 /DNA_START=71 /DNA_END=931 /DNA_ORIENTATION=+